MPPPQELDRSNDGQDHTVLPYARLAISPQFFQPCRRSRKLTGETSLTASSVRATPWAHGEQSALPLASRPTLPRPLQARLAYRDDVRSPLLGEPGWATHTPFPNFGKVEYFHKQCLTRCRAFCPTCRGSLSVKLIAANSPVATTRRAVPEEARAYLAPKCAVLNLVGSWPSGPGVASRNLRNHQERNSPVPSAQKGFPNFAWISQQQPQPELSTRSSSLAVDRA